MHLKDFQGIYDFRLPHIALIGKDRARLRKTVFAGFTSIQAVRSVALLLRLPRSGYSTDRSRCYSCSIHSANTWRWMWTLCTPPCTFGLFKLMSRECVDNEFNVYWQRVECHLRWSSTAGDLDLGRRCPICGSTLLYYRDNSIYEVHFLRFIFDGHFAFVFVVPVNTFARDLWQSFAISRNM
jgi:hypothetical protein